MGLLSPVSLPWDGKLPCKNRPPTDRSMYTKQDMCSHQAPRVLPLRGSQMASSLALGYGTPPMPQVWIQSQHRYCNIYSCSSLSSALFPAHNRDDLSLQKSPTKSLLEFLDHRPQLKFCLSIESLAYGQISDLAQYACHSDSHSHIIELGWICGQQLTACPTTALLEVKEIITTSPNLRKLTIHSAKNPNVGNVGLILEEDEKVPALESLDLARYNWTHTVHQIHSHWDLSRLHELKVMDMNHCAFLFTVSPYDLAGLEYLYIRSDQSSNEEQNHAIFKLLETA